MAYGMPPPAPQRATWNAPSSAASCKLPHLEPLDREGKRLSRRSRASLAELVERRNRRPTRLRVMSEFCVELVAAARSHLARFSMGQSCPTAGRDLISFNARFRHYPPAPTR